MSTRPLLTDSPKIHEAQPVDDVAELRLEMQELRDEFGRFRVGVEQNLQQLAALLHRVKSAFAVNTDGNSPSQEQPRASRVWQSWIEKLPGRKADLIRALLEHGPMTGTQLEIAAHCPHGSLAQVIHELKRLNLISKNGDKYSLKEL